nr:hypothetical protein [Tanacetum cinerariifolium]
MDGKVHAYKARLVTKGYTQTHRIVYQENFSLVAKIESIRIMLAIAAFHDYEIRQMDVNIAFPNKKLTEDVFMGQPEGFKIATEDESGIYVKVSVSVVVFHVLYVDDILHIGNDIPTLQSIKEWLGKCFAMKDLGDAPYILGLMYPFAFIMVSQQQQNPGEGHWIAVKNILKYSRNTKDRFLVYVREEELRVTGYCNASWQTDKEDSRSQSGWIFLLNRGEVK